MPINTFYFMKKTKYLPIATLTSGTLNVLLNILLIPYIGIWGAAITTTLSFAINWWLLEVLSSKTFKVKFDRSALVFLFALVVVSNLLFYLMPSEDLYIRLLSQVIFVGGVILIVWFKDIGNIREFIKARLNK